MAAERGDQVPHARRRFDLLRPRAVEGFLDDCSVLHIAGTCGLAGDYQGREAIVGVLEAMADASAQTMRFEVACVTPGLGHTWRLTGTLHGQRAGQALEVIATVRAAVTGRRVREAWLDCADQVAWDAFWGQGYRP